MAQSVIGALRVNLGLDSAQFSRGLTDAQKNIANAKKQFLTIAAVASAAFAGITAAAMAGAREIDQTAKAARRLDASTTGFQSLQLAASEAGVSLSSLTNDVQTLNRELASNSAGAQRSMKALGLATSDLAALDADEKLALIADRIKDAGMNAGQASVILRDLGIRNREMALAVIQGGDAFRNARNDVQSYGLELSTGTTSAMEQANDRIGRLSIVTTSFSRNLASQLVPALGRFAEKITDSVREGGQLRGVLDSLKIVSGILARAVDLVSNNLEFLIDLFKVLLGAKIAIFLASAVTGMISLARAVRTAGIVSAAFTTITKSKVLALALVAAVVAKATGQFENMSAWLNRTGAALMDALPEDLRDNVNSLGDSIVGLGSSIEELDDTQATSLATAIQAGEVAADSFGSAERGALGAKSAIEDVTNATNATTDALQDMASRGVDGLADAFADFAMRGFRDFKSFARSIVDTFKSMLRDMIAMAARNKIMLSLGMGGSVAGSAASAATGSAVGTGIGGAIAGAGGLAGLGSAALGGAQFVASGFATGGLAGAGSAIGTALSGATLGIGGAAAALGAVAAPLLAVYAAVKFFSKTTKTLDEGIKVAVKGMETSAETFKTIQTSRFFGLSKKTSTNTKSDPDNPIIGAVNAMQASALEAARVLGVGAAAFENFSYDFKLSLKGLTEDQRIAKINEELGKMGDEFASLVPNVENLNQLLERANQISASIRALTDTQTLFATRQEAVFAASQAGSLSADVDTTQGLLRDLIRAVREGDVNNGRLTAQLVAIQQRQELAPT